VTAKKRTCRPIYLKTAAVKKRAWRRDGRAVMAKSPWHVAPGEGQPAGSIMASRISGIKANKISGKQYRVRGFKQHRAAGLFARSSIACGAHNVWRQHGPITLRGGKSACIAAWRKSGRKTIKARAGRSGGGEMALQYGWDGGLEWRAGNIS